MQILWESLLDYKYRCFVSQINKNEGKLHLVDCTLDHQLVWSTVVPLSPNTNADIQQWMKDITFVVDRLNKKKKT